MESNGSPKPLPRLLVYFGRYRGRALAALAMMAAVSALTVVFLFLVNKLIDDALGAGASGTLTGFGKSPRAAAPLIAWLQRGYAAMRSAADHAGLPARLAVPLLLLATLVAKNVCSYFSEFALNGIGIAMVRDLRNDAYRQLLRKSARFYSQASTGDLLSRMLSDVEQIQSAFGTRLADFAQGVLTILLVLVYAFSLNPGLAFGVFVIAPISWAAAGGIWTSSSPRVIAAMLPSSFLSGTVIERTISAVKPSAIASATIPPMIERSTTRSASRADASRPASACCST